MFKALALSLSVLLGGVLVSAPPQKASDAKKTPPPVVFVEKNQKPKQPRKPLPPRSELIIVAPAETKVYVPVKLALNGATKATQARWKITPTPAWQETVPLKTDAKGAVVEQYGMRFTGAPGIYKIAVLYVDFDAKMFGELDTDVRIVGAGPKPPDPDPDPDPDDVDPPPPPLGPAPIPVPGFRVLVLYETGDQTGYTVGEINMLYAKEVRDYLNAKCVKEGVTPGFRIYDKDVVMTGESDVWKNAVARAKEKMAAWKPVTRRKVVYNGLTPEITLETVGDHQALPWLIISDGTKGWEGPMPDKFEDAFALIKQYGGQ